MIFSAWPWRALISGACLLGATGCGPMAESTVDEQREAHFLNGKARAQALDFPGAIEAFERATEVNPRNASAHFELGTLNEDKSRDFAAAIYHYERFLRLRPESAHADIIRQHVLACKQQLASTVLLEPVTPSMTREAMRPMDTVRTPTNVPGATAIPRNSSPAPALKPSVPAGPPTAAPPPAAKTYTVKPGDTPTSIARKHNVKLATLLKANGGIDPKHLRIGQTLTIPSP